jgi:hypothetical protein
MISTMRARFAVLAAFTATAVACSEAPVFTPELSAPAAPAAPDIAASHGSNDEYIGSGRTLRRYWPLQVDEVDSVLVVPTRRASLMLRHAGLRIEIPKGAVSAPVWVKAFAPRGPKVYYEFTPSPYHFQLPVTVIQDLRNTRAYWDPNTAASLTGAYLPGGLDDIALDGTANIGEVFETSIVPEHNRSLSRLAAYQTDHFSGYILAVGFAPRAR